jgi:hypothetical protein
MKLWNWFPASIFDLPTLHYWQTFGLNLFIGYMRGLRLKDKDKEKTIEDDVKEYIELILFELMALGLGFVYYSLFM